MSTQAASALRRFRRPRLWLGLWALMILAVIVGSLLPARDLPTSPFNHFDKLEHLLGYAVLSAYATMLFARMKAQARAAAALVVLGVALEIAQGALTATRSADAADALTDAIGVLAGLMIAATPLSTWLQRWDAHLR